MNNAIISTCPQCGASIPMDTLYCTYCGYKIDLSITNSNSEQADDFYTAYNALLPHIEPIVSKFVKEIDTFLDLDDEKVVLRIEYNDKKNNATCWEVYEVSRSQTEPQSDNIRDECILNIRRINRQEDNRLCELGIDTTLFDRCEQIYDGLYNAYINISKDKCANDGIKQILLTMISIRIANEVSLKEACFKSAAIKYEIIIMTHKKLLEMQKQAEIRHKESGAEGAREWRNKLIWLTAIILLVIQLCCS